MRTDRHRDRDDPGGIPLSRRTFVLAGGIAVTAGAAVGPGSVGASDEGDRVVVAATEPYLPAVRVAAETYEESPLSVRPAGEADREADLRISGRPIEDGEAARGIAVRGGAALAHAQDEWRECRCRSDLRDRWADDTPVETWSESGWSDVAALDRTASLDGAHATDSVFVRGTRSYQYADGRGGVGYYGVDPTELNALPSDPDDHTPLVRVEYLHFEEDALSSDGLASFLRHYDRRTGDAADVAAFVDPAVDD